MTTKFTLKSILLAAIATFLISSTNAQTFTCGSDEVLEQWRTENPHTFNDHETAGEVINTGRREKMIIPVVFHVLHSNGPENIAESRILDQLKILNQDFSATNADLANVRNHSLAPFQPLIADFEIEFVLAKRDPQGRCTNGINRMFTTIGEDARDNVKELVLWPPDRYLNIWVVKSINSSGADGTVMGFANFPWYTPSKDGVVMIASEMGYGPITQGRVLTHEIGHWLGLLHTFQGGCSFPNDRVDDTPLVKEQFTNTSCPKKGDSCPNDTTGKTVGDSLYDQWENFMDYSHGCMVMFTKGQKERVLYYLTSKEYSRHKLYSSENLEFTGITPSATKPIASFNADSRVICAGSPVKFTSVACTGINITGREWTFDGAETTSSTETNPTVIYNNPGKYAVKLKVTNSAGEDEYEVKEYIHVHPFVTNQVGLFEDFEVKNGNKYTGSGFYNVEEPGYSPFILMNGIGYSGKQSIKAPINNLNYGDKFAIETPSLDMTKIDGDPIISMMVSYARRDKQAKDYLKIYTSDDCGATWKRVNQKESRDLFTYDGYAVGFEPTNEEDWKMISYTFSSPAYKNATNLKIRIVVESGGGNPVYIDDINLNQFFTSTPTFEKPLDVAIFPNPSNGNFTIQLAALSLNTFAKISIVDINGKSIAILQDNMVSGQNLSLEVNPKDYNITNGLYFVKIQTDEGVVTKKLIITD